MLESIKSSVYVWYMDTKPLSITGLWVLMALAPGPRHGYLLADAIARLSYMNFRPSAQRVEHAVHRLAKLGYIGLVWTDIPRGSPHCRFVYGLTASGERRLKLEERDIHSTLLELRRVLYRQSQYIQQVRQLLN